MASWALIINGFILVGVIIGVIYLVQTLIKLNKVLDLWLEQNKTKANEHYWKQKANLYNIW